MANIDPIYKLNGKEFTKEQLEASASYHSLSFDDYVSSRNFEIIQPEDFQNGAAENNAPVVPKNNQALNNGGSVSENGSSDLPGNLEFGEAVDFDFNNPYSEPKKERRYIQFKSGRVYEDTYLSELEENPTDEYNREKPKTFEEYAEQMGGSSSSIRIYKPDTFVKEQKSVDARVIEAINSKFEQTEEQKLEKRAKAEEMFVPQADRPTHMVFTGDYSPPESIVTKNEDYDKYVGIAKNKLGNNASEDEILSVAKNLYVDASVKPQIAKNIEQSLKDGAYDQGSKDFLNEADSDFIKKAAAREYKTKNKAQQANVAKLESMGVLMKATIAEMEALQKQSYSLDTFDAEAARERYKYLRSTLEVASENYNEFYNNSYLVVNEELEGLADIVDVTKRAYGIGNVLAANVVATTSELIGGALKAPEWLGTIIESAITGEEYNNTWMAQNTGMLSEALLDTEMIRGAVAKPVDVADIGSDGTNLGYWMTDLIGNQIPTAATMIAFPASSLYVMGASAAGQKANDMAGLMESSEADYNNWQMLLAPAIVGTLETVTEKISLGQLKHVGKVFQGKNSVLKEATDYIQNRVLNKNYFVDVLGEGASEGLNQLGGNITDKYLLKDKNVHIWDGVGNAVASGGFMSGVVYKAPSIGVKMLNPFASSDLKPNIYANIVMQNKLAKEMLNKDISPNIKSSLKQAYDKLNEANNKLLNDQFKTIDALNDDQKTELIEIDKAKAKALLELQDINGFDNMSDSVKQNLIEGKESEINSLAANKEKILSTVGADADVALTKSLIEGAKDGSSVMVFEDDTKTKVTAAQKQYDFLISVGLSEAQAEAKKNDYGLFVQDKDGNDILVINKASALEDKVVTTGKHEFLHKVLKRAIAKDPSLAENMGNMLLTEIANNPSIITERGKQAIKQYKERADDVNDSTTQSDYFEEIITVFAESMNPEAASQADTFTSKIADIVRRAMNSLGIRNVKFKTSKDVVNFIKDYNRDFASGKLSRTLQKFEAGEGEVVSAETKSSAKQKPTVLQTINQLIPEGVKTKAELQKPRVFNRIYEATLENGAISNYVKSRSENKAVYEKAIESIQERLINYDPAAVRKKANGQPITFGEFIFANTNFGKLDAKKKLAIESKEAKEKTSVDSKEAKQVADVSEAPVRVAEKPKYKNLVQSKVVSTDALKSISGKVGKIVRTLKSRMDAKTSINKTISPLIAEIKKEMGKQADIDLKKEIGGKKDDQIKKYLLANKKAILENMTTTWLMQAMPGAIQKQVDGKFTSDWKGKKIDREKVSTNAAGKTSGAEIVRRLPNPSVSLDDATYLGYIIDDKGAPIRGRKESLAKAMAEEISFDIFSQQIKDPESDISKAFETNQERLGVVIAENIVEDLTRQIDRGTVKFSAKIINHNKENPNFIPDFLEDMRSATFQQIFSENYRNGVNRPWFDSAIKYFEQKYPKGSEERSLTINAVKDIANDFAMKNSNKKPVEVAVLRAAQDPEQWQEALDAVNEKVEDALTLGTAYDTVGMIYTGRTNQFDDASLDGINEARYALKALIDSLAEKGMTRNEIRAALKDAYVGPGGIGKFTVGSKDALLTLTDENLGEFKGGSRGAIVLNATDFDNNFLKDVKNEGPKVVNDSNIFKKDYWTKPTSKFNKMDSKGQWGFLNNLFNQGIKNQVKLENTIESIKDLDVSAANKRWLIRGLFAAMPALGKATSTTRYVLVNNDGSLVSFEELKRKGLAAKDDKGVFEHTKPANRVSVAAYAYAIAPSKATKTALDNELKDFDSALISEKMDKVLVGLKLQSKMGLGYKVGTGPMLSRYRELIAELDSKGVYFYDIKTNKKILPATKFNDAFLATAKAGLKSSAKISGVTEGGASTFVPNVKGGFSKSSTGLKAIFMVGGPGAGKTNVGKGLQLGRRGYKVVNQDIALEAMKTEVGLPAKESDYDAEQRSTRSKIGAAARKAAVAKFDKYADNGNGMVIDGTGASYNATTKKIKALQAKGFEVHMVVANTPLSTAIERNRARTERSLPDFVVQKTYDQVQESLMKYREDFGDRLYEINTESIKFGEALPSEFLKQVHNGINKNIVTLNSSVKSSVKLSKEFNNMIERGTGTLSDAKFSSVVAKRRGARKGRFKVWMPTSLDDFKGLTSYVFAGKGRQGDADQKWFQDNLIDPYFKGIAAIEVARQTMTDDFKALNKMFKPVVKSLGKLTKDGDYTNDQAIRIYLWDKAGYEIPGLSKRDLSKMLKHIENNPDLKAYADAALVISKQDKWVKPGSFWDAQTILSDLGNMTEKTGRKEYIAEFIENSKEIFSVDNLNKIEAVYGTRQADALKDILYRMENGTNRPSGMNKNANRFNNWVNNSIGSIMFFNRRSALLQTLSTVNFINWSDNNPAKAALAFANQPQFWKDFSTLFNSPKLKQRRSGLKSDINEAEIASAVKGSKNKAVAALSWLLKKGFTPTQMADSFAIASGGATFYRNRVNSYLKEQAPDKELTKQNRKMTYGPKYTREQAEQKAFEDFSKISEETQQSGDPALISSDQASTVGRMLLAFQNTPIQLNRSIKKSAQNIYNRRRVPGLNQFQSDVTHLSQIIYYGAIQNIIFSTLQNALFALLPGFDDEEPTDEELAAKLGEKSNRILNGIISTTLKGGFGIPGAVVDTIKNVIQEYNKQDEKGFTGDHTYTILQAANLAPPIGSKLSKIYKGIQAKRFNKDVIENRGYDVVYDGRFNISPAYSVLGNVVEGTTNFPMARAVDELNSITEAFDTRNTVMQRIALGLGWKAWNVGATNEEHILIKTNAKLDKKEKKKEERAKGKKKKAKKAKDYSDVPFHKLPPKEKAKRLARKRAEIAKSKNK